MWKSGDWWWFHLRKGSSESEIQLYSTLEVQFCDFSCLRPWTLTDRSRGDQLAVLLFSYRNSFFYIFLFSYCKPSTRMHFKIKSTQLLIEDHSILACLVKTLVKRNLWECGRSWSKNIAFWAHRLEVVSCLQNCARTCCASPPPPPGGGITQSLSVTGSGLDGWGSIPQGHGYTFASASRPALGSI